MPDTHKVTRRMGLRTALAAIAAIPLLGAVPASAAEPGDRREPCPPGGRRYFRDTPF